LNALKSAVRAGLHSLGGINAFRWRHKRDVRILMYHGFSENRDGLRRQCEQIRRSYQPVSMSQVSAALNGGATLPDHAVAITVDDGYRNFLTNGYPCFREFEIPATVFLVSDFLDRKTWLWWNQIEYAFEYTTNRVVDLQLGAKSLTLTLGRPDERQQQAHCIAESLTNVTNCERLERTRHIFDVLGVDIPAEPPPAWEALHWEEVRQLASGNVEFGAHTKTHPILSSIGEEASLREEIQTSKLRVEQELGRPVVHFCYPNGRQADIGPEVLRITRESGFQTAVTTEPGMNQLGSGTDPFQLKRLGVDPDYPVSYFDELLAGVRLS